MTEKPTSTVNFRKLLLNRCQKEFEKDKVDDVVFERRQKELDSTASVCDVGNCSFNSSWGVFDLFLKIFSMFPSLASDN